VGKKRISYLKFYSSLTWTPIDTVYSDYVLPLQARWVELLGRICRVEVQKTLLGYELKMGVVRKNCPDLVTARYLRIFAAIGKGSISIPYNPVDTARILPMLEQSFQEINRKILALSLKDSRFDEIRRNIEDVSFDAFSFEEITRVTRDAPDIPEWRRRLHYYKRNIYHLLNKRICRFES